MERGKIRDGAEEKSSNGDNNSNDDDDADGGYGGTGNKCNVPVRILAVVIGQLAALWRGLRSTPVQN